MAIGEEIDRILKADKTVIPVDIGIGLFGFSPPTMDLNVTVALAIMSIVLVEAAGIRKKGFSVWLSDK